MATTVYIGDLQTCSSLINHTEQLLNIAHIKYRLNRALSDTPNNLLFSLCVCHLLIEVTAIELQLLQLVFILYTIIFTVMDSVGLGYLI